MACSVMKGIKSPTPVTRDKLGEEAWFHDITGKKARYTFADVLMWEEEERIEIIEGRPS